MKSARSVWMLAASISVLLLTSGCSGGGLSNLFGLFGWGDGGGSSGNSGILSSLAGGGDGANELAGIDGSGGDSTQSGVSTIATVHHPEPGSLVLFGGGLASALFSRRRKKAYRVRQ